MVVVRLMGVRVLPIRLALCFRIYRFSNDSQVTIFAASRLRGRFFHVNFCLTWVTDL